jgi:hypothetical protein
MKDKLTRCACIVLAVVSLLLFAPALSAQTYIGMQTQPGPFATETGSQNTYIPDDTATAAGYITNIEVYGGSNGGTLVFAVLSRSGLNFTDLVHDTLGAVVADQLNTYSAGTDFDSTALPISVGQFIGISFTGVGNIDRDETTGSGYFYLGESEATSITNGVSDLCGESTATRTIQVWALITTAAEVAGPNSPTVATSIRWTNPTNVFASDDSWTDYTYTGTVYPLITEDFDFSIPEAGPDSVCIIESIDIDVEGWTNAAALEDSEFDVWLTKVGTTTQAGDKEQYLYLSYGTSGDETTIHAYGNGLWSTTWTREEINKSDGAGFGVIVSPIDGPAGTQYHLDWVGATVYYHYEVVSSAGRRRSLLSREGN